MGIFLVERGIQTSENLNLLTGDYNSSRSLHCVRPTSRFTSRPEGRGQRRFFDFSGREMTFFRNSLQGEGREWEKETQCGKGLGSWDT